MKKLWDKGIEVSKLIEEFTIGRDRELDLLLAPYDVKGSIAHAIMLEKIGILDKNELEKIKTILKQIYQDIEKSNFVIEEGVEDVHSQIELLLTRSIGDAGKKIHTARSRNDQVLLDLKLYIRDHIRMLAEGLKSFFNNLIIQSEKYKDYLMPGYTHLQIAMPSSFGLWFGAYAESLADDLLVLLAAFNVTNQNPLGSAAGYGSSFPIDRELTTKLLGFETMNYNVVYAQMGRGKVERLVSFALGTIASTMSKMAYDLCMFMSQNFGFVSLPEELTTGSSIMPHKKNPDVFELIRAKSNKVQALTNEISMITNNLPSGYFRDVQIVKESFLQSFDYLTDIINILNYSIRRISVKTNILKDELYKYIFSVEEVNKLVQKGIPFRDAYKQIGEQIKRGEFSPELKVSHVHEGSIGNLCNNEIIDKFNKNMVGFSFNKYLDAEEKLLL